VETLLDEQYAPITKEIGFLELPIDSACRGLVDWRRELGRDVASREARSGFPEALLALQPLTSGGSPRELLVEHGEWTAYFDNSLRGTDAWGPISYLAERLKCRGLLARSVPDTKPKRGEPGRYGSVQFDLYGPQTINHSNSLRGISATNDGGRWVFVDDGVRLPFEQPERYTAARIRDRFTSSMLADYCEALGIHLFDPDAYGPAAVLIESSAIIGESVMSLAEAQAFLGIVPGAARALP
jgi:hypothetical protein